MKGFLAIVLSLFMATSAATVPEQAIPYRQDMTKSAWRTFGLNAPVATLAAQIHQESMWKSEVESHAGAQGIAQFMPSTAEDMARRFPEICAPANPFSPKWAFACRDRYMKRLNEASKNENTTECDEWAFGLRAYNGGLGWINRDRKKAKLEGANPDNWVEVQPFNAGRAAWAYKENTQYIIRIFNREYDYSSWGRTLNCIDLED